MSEKMIYRGRIHGPFEDEWLLHKKCSEWWYATGTLKDGQDREYSFQFTMIRARVFGICPYILMLALTDFQTKKHHYFQDFDLIGTKAKIRKNAVYYGDRASAVKNEKGILIHIDGGDFGFKLQLDYGKGAFWHCEDGYLKMGVDRPNQSTFYYSYTNMPASGTIRADGEVREVTGKGWFDKQGGPYDIIKAETHWEWFSLRFFDDEEMMLFSFPQDNYRDGTYISKAGQSCRLNNYSLEATAFTSPDGNLKYACEWKLSVPGLKDGEYTIVPKMDGQMNIGYYELLADIINADGEKKGLCFVELLPGARNEKFANILLSKTK
ncbi:MAG: carotenoid 1,2-hydratase [Clostridiales bacterium]|nr:carotenoid 1,2-hydratase [Clostridiales bacterium]